MKFIGAIWGIAGVTYLVGKSIHSLAQYSLEAIHHGLSLWQWIFLVIYAFFMLVFEGYRGFQKKFCPRTAARVLYLYNNPRPLHVLLAPFFCMGYFHATKRTKIAAIAISLLILAVVFLMREYCPQPWRGIIDFGVVLGLSYGIICFFIFCFIAFTRPNFPYSPEVPKADA